ncbi:tetratricopeptide repeat protein [Persephonella sp.]
MSLMIQMLRKIKSKKGAKPVPPGLEVKNSLNKRVLFLSLITIILILTGIGVFYYLTSIPQQNILVNENIVLRERSKPIQPPQTEKEENLDIQSNVPINDPIPERETSEKEELPPLEAVLNEIQENVEDLDANEPEIDKDVYKNTALISRSSAEISLREPRENRSAQISAYITLAEKYLEEGNLSKAYTYYKKLYDLKRSEEILHNILILAVETGNIQELRKYLPEIKSEETISSIVIKLVDNEKYSLAKEVLNSYADQDKKGLIDYAKGYFYENTGNTSEAIFYYERAYSKNPSDPYIAYAYARMLEIKGAQNKAYKVYRKILNLSCENEFLLNVVRERINLLEALGDR